MAVNKKLDGKTIQAAPACSSAKLTTLPVLVARCGVETYGARSQYYSYSLLRASVSPCIALTPGSSAANLSERIGYE